MIRCKICDRLTPGYSDRCSRCLAGWFEGCMTPTNRFLLDFLRAQEDEIEMAFVRWQAEHREGGT